MLLNIGRKNKKYINMAIQKELNLNEPLSHESNSTLSQKTLTPDYSEALLNLHADYYRQMQAKCNRSIFWNPISVSAWILGISLSMYYILSDIIKVSDSFSDILQHDDVVTQGLMVFPALIFNTGIIGLFSFILSDDFRVVSDKLQNPTFFTDLFGFDLKKFAALPIDTTVKKTSEKLLFKQAENTNLVIYRESPIAIISVKPLTQKSTAENFVVKVTGLHVRKVFEKVDFDDLLIEWAIERSKKLNTGNAPKVTIIIEAYAFDKLRKRTLKNKFFEKISSTPSINPFTAIVEAEEAAKDIIKVDSDKKFLFVFSSEKVNKLFGIQRETYSLVVSNKETTEKI